MIVTDNLASGQGEPRCKEDGRSLHDVGIPAQRRDTGLAHLFGFGHTQSDDVPGKKAGVQFVKNVVNLLRTHDVVIADK